MPTLGPEHGLCQLGLLLYLLIKFRHHAIFSSSELNSWLRQALLGLQRLSSLIPSPRRSTERLLESQTSSCRPRRELEFPVPGLLVFALDRQSYIAPVTLEVDSVTKCGRLTLRPSRELRGDELRICIQRDINPLVAQITMNRTSLAIPLPLCPNNIP